MPRGSIGFFTGNGLLQPDAPTGPGRGRPQVYGFADFVTALAIVQLRLPAATRGLRNLGDALRELYGRPDSSNDERRVYLLLLPSGRLVVKDADKDKSGELSFDLEQVTKALDAGVMHVVVAHRLADQAIVLLTQSGLIGRRIEPDERGRIPRKAPAARVKMVVDVPHAEEPRRSKKRVSRETLEKR